MTYKYIEKFTTEEEETKEPLEGWYYGDTNNTFSLIIEKKNINDEDENNRNENENINDEDETNSIKLKFSKKHKNLPYEKMIEVQKKRNEKALILLVIPVIIFIILIIIIKKWLDSFLISVFGIIIWLFLYLRLKNKIYQDGFAVGILCSIVCYGFIYFTIIIKDD